MGLFRRQRLFRFLKSRAPHFSRSAEPCSVNEPKIIDLLGHISCSGGVRGHTKPISSFPAKMKGHATLDIDVRTIPTGLVHVPKVCVLIWYHDQMKKKRLQIKKEEEERRQKKRKLRKRRRELKKKKRKMTVAELLGGHEKI